MPPKTKVSRFAVRDAELAAIVRRPGCQVCTWLEQQAAEDVDFLHSLMCLPSKKDGTGRRVVQHVYVQRLIAEDGPEFSADVISLHRRAHLDL